ncbi:MAG: 2-nitropropane dioxygenase [Saprospiraceae bacterium]|nr:MAG: 2-nitropropane dioxygenase [Saprospiraceae bacterium]
MENKNSNKASRRNFVKQSSLVGIALSTSFISTSCNESKAKPEIKELGKLNENSKKLLSTFNIKYPFFQAAPGGEELAVAIAKSGGMGAMQFWGSSPESVYEASVRLSERTNGKFYANYVLHWPPETIANALKGGCRNFQFSWGLPSREVVQLIKDADAKFGIQVTSKLNALKALSLDPDFMICQGIEAGGHVQGTSSIKKVLPEIIEASGDVPILVSGGISTGHDIRKAINTGAAGVVMGSRFVATVEGNHHQIYKQSLVDADENSTVYTNCFNNGGWHAMHRVLRNSTFQTWEAAGCPLIGDKPGEDDILSKSESGREIKRYAINSPKKGMTGDIEALVLYAGEGVSKIQDIPKAEDLIVRLWNEFENK